MNLLFIYFRLIKIVSIYIFICSFRFL